MAQAHQLLTGVIIQGGHFTWEEARCNCCGRLPDKSAAVKNAARMMEEIRTLLGDQPVRVNSWFRCPAHNTRIGGASDSQHLHGRAVDFTVKNLEPRQVAKRLRGFLGGGDLIGGLGSYPGFTHADNRPDGRGAYWEE